MPAAFSLPASPVRNTASPAPFVSSQINGDPDAICVHASGELDIATAPRLKSALDEAVSRAGLVVLDLGDLTFIDSAGVRAIVNCSDRARHVGRRLVILPGPASVARIFALTPISNNLEIGHPDSLNPQRPHVRPTRRLYGGPDGPQPASRWCG